MRIKQKKNTINLVLTNPKWENSRKVSQNSAPNQRYKPNSLKRFEECLNGIVCYWPWITISTNGNICYSNLLYIHLFDLMFNFICSDVVVEQVTANNEMSLSCFVNDIECYSSDPNSRWLKLFSFVSPFNRKCTKNFVNFINTKKKQNLYIINLARGYLDGFFGCSINGNFDIKSKFEFNSIICLILFLCGSAKSSREKKIVTSSIFNLSA